MIVNPVWTLFTDWQKPPLSMNDRGQHWASHGPAIARIRQQAHLLATAANVPPMDHVIVRMVWTVPTRVRRDAENPVATMKPFCDGLVDAGVVIDDIPIYMTKLMPEIVYVKGLVGVRFELTAATLGEACPLCGSSNPVALCPPPGARGATNYPAPVPSIQEAP